MVWGGEDGGGAENGKDEVGGEGEEAAEILLNCQCHWVAGASGRAAFLVFSCGAGFVVSLEFFMI